MNGVTGPDGHAPAPDPLDPRDPRAGRLRLGPRGHLARADPRRPHRVQAARARRGARPRALHDRPRRGAGRPATSRSTSTRRSPAPRRTRFARPSAPASTSTARSRSPRRSSALDLARRARAAGVKNGVVQDKLCLPGLRKLKRLVDGGFFGRILSVRGEFGYWVFAGPGAAAAAPVLELPRRGRRRDPVDMFCHWRYVLDHSSARCASSTRTARRTSPSGSTSTGSPYPATAEDAAYAIVRARGRDRRADQLVLGRARRPRRAVRAAGRRHRGQRRRGPARCRVQHRRGHAQAALEPGPAEPDRLPRGLAARCPDRSAYDNGFKVQWELFLRHVVLDEPFPWDFMEGAKGIQLAELGMRSWRSGAPRRPGAPAVSAATTVTEPLPLPRAGRSARAAGPRARRRLPARRRAPAAAAASPSPPRTSSPTRSRTRPRRSRAARLGGDARLPPPPVVATASRVAEAMDTAQRGMGLDWPATQELIRRSVAEARAAGGQIACGAGTDHLAAGPADARRRPARLRRAGRVHRGRGRAGHPDGEPRARRRRAGPGRLPRVYGRVLAAARAAR